MASNLDLVRSIYAAWERSDYTDVAWADHEIEYVMDGGPDPGAYRGVEGMAEAFRSMLAAWTDWRVTADDYVEVDRERVLVGYRFSARGRASGVEVGQLQTRGATLFELRAGRVTRIVQYFSRERALAELGLEHETASQRRVAMVRALIDIWNAGVRDRGLFSAYLDPAIRFDSPLSSLHGEPYAGYAGIEQWTRDLDEQFAEWVIQADEIRAVGDRAIALGTVQARGRASGAPLAFDSASVFDFADDDRVIRVQIYTDTGAALSAVGLDE